jgi:predicted acyl esterase
VPSAPAAAGTTDYAAPGGAVAFETEIEQDRLELTGPAVLHLWVSSTTADADLYVRLRQFRPDGAEVLGIDPSGDPVQSLAQGWLRASMRELDPRRSTPWRPFHSHTAAAPLAPGEPVELDVEIWPTSMVLERGDRLVLEVSSSDQTGAFFKMGQDTADRPEALFDGSNTVHTGPVHPGYLRLPVIPRG